jgi:hypothetical protein
MMIDHPRWVLEVYADEGDSGTNRMEDALGDAFEKTLPGADLGLWKDQADEPFTLPGELGSYFVCYRDNVSTRLGRHVELRIFGDRLAPSAKEAVPPAFVIDLAIALMDSNAVIVGTGGRAPFSEITIGSAPMVFLRELAARNGLSALDNRGVLHDKNFPIAEFLAAVRPALGQELVLLEWKDSKRFLSGSFKKLASSIGQNVFTERFGKFGIPWNQSASKSFLRQLFRRA